MSRYGKNLAMIIRPENPKEFEELYQLIETAFKTAEVASGTEQEFADRLRAGENYIPDLALVAEADGKIIGHVMFTKLRITGGTREHTVLILAPIAVVKEFRGQGVGSTLIREGFVRAKALGYDAVILVGSPLYYGRFGFTELAGFGIRHSEDFPSMYVLGVELRPGALAGINGYVEFPT
ncbi:hypothetical protein McpAg1_01400 [Methanocorpusculaceae archaeon Ag1]|uniref:N-acetyltransferase domain-containing protein n=2 Tax=Methanorbis furvi TaxID=3028299 RepID=A0AAE4S9A2_9EURY|nr:hypothetical protein [Methanocorpusculaceae archaeon Ag1]